MEKKRNKKKIVQKRKMKKIAVNLRKRSRRKKLNK